MATTNPSRSVSAALLQTCREWPVDDGGWTTHDEIAVHGAEEGCGQVVGSATADMDAARKIVQPGARMIGSVSIPGLSTLTGKWCRILLEKVGGSISYNGKAWSPIWWGEVGEQSIAIDGDIDTPGGLVSWDLLGIANALDRLYIYRGYELDYSDALVDPGECPLFNGLPGGDRSASPILLNSGLVYVHDRGAPGGRWTVQDIVDYILAAFGQPDLPGIGIASALKWRLDVTTGALLDFDAGPSIDLAGRTVLQALNMLINPARGLTWRVTVSGQTATIKIYSVSRSAVTFPVIDASGTTTGNVTIPAATPTTLDLGGSLWIGSPRISNAGDYYDLIRAQLARPWVCMTLWYKKSDANSSLIPDGWTESDNPDDTPAGEHRWRRWKINPAWNGSQYADASVGLRNKLTTTASGQDGTRSYDAAIMPPPASLEISRDLPYAAGFNVDKNGPRALPLVIIGAGSAWVDVSTTIEMTPVDWPAGVILGNGAAAAATLKASLNGTGKYLLVTVGIREPLPLTLSWNRTGGAPRDLPRCLTRRVDGEQWVGLKGTVIGLTSGGALTKTSAMEVIRDDIEHGVAELAQAVARFGSEGGEVSYTNDGTIITSDNLAPGTLIGDVEVGSATFTCNAVITRRSWSFDFDTFGTTIRAERLAQQVEARP